MGSKRGELLLGCTGNESSVVKMVVSGAPKSGPRPSTSSLAASLPSVLGEAKVGKFSISMGLRRGWRVKR